MRMELTEEKSLNNSFKNSLDNKKYVELVFRNKMSEDTILTFSKGISLNISEIKKALLKTLKLDENNTDIKLFFKGRPLKNEENLDSLSKIY
jgi:hypothetical protein